MKHLHYHVLEKSFTRFSLKYIFSLLEKRSYPIIILHQNALHSSPPQKCQRVRCFVLDACITRISQQDFLEFMSYLRNLCIKFNAKFSHSVFLGTG